MPVKIVRRGEKPSASVVSKEGIKIIKKTLAPEPIGGRPVFSKAIKVGKAEILPDVDVHDVQGKTKFLIHFRKPGIWFRVMAFDENTGQLKLRSIHGNVFESKVDGTVPKNYLVVMEPEGVAFPSPEAVAKVYGLSGVDASDEKMEYYPMAKLEEAPAPPSVEDEKKDVSGKAARADVVGHKPEVKMVHKKAPKKEDKTIRKSGKVSIKRKK